MADETVAEVALASATEINQLRDELAKRVNHGLALNQVCWALATALGDVGDGETAVQLVPMDLVRRIIEHRNDLEAKVLAVIEVLGAHKNGGRDSAGYDLWGDVRLAVIDD